MSLPRLALLCAWAVACADAARAEVALTEALAKTYLENPRLEAARAHLRAVDEDVPASKAGWHPRLSARTAIGMERTTTIVGDAVVQGQQAGIFLEQPVYDGGATQAAVEGAEAAVRAERERLLAEEQDVLLLGVRAFVGVLRQQRVLEIALANERRLGEQLGGTRSRFRYGQSTGTDVAFAEARSAEAVARRREAEAGLRTAGSAFKRVIGDPPGTLIPPGLPPGCRPRMARPSTSRGTTRWRRRQGSTFRWRGRARGRRWQGSNPASRSRARPATARTRRAAATGTSVLAWEPALPCLFTTAAEATPASARAASC